MISITNEPAGRRGAFREVRIPFSLSRHGGGEDARVACGVPVQLARAMQPRASKTAQLALAMTSATALVYLSGSRTALDCANV